MVSGLCRQGWGLRWDPSAAALTWLLGQGANELFSKPFSEAGKEKRLSLLHAETLPIPFPMILVRLISVLLGSQQQDSRKICDGNLVDFAVTAYTLVSSKDQSHFYCILRKCGRKDRSVAV